MVGAGSVERDVACVCVDDAVAEGGVGGGGCEGASMMIGGQAVAESGGQ